MQDWPIIGIDKYIPALVYCIRHTQRHLLLLKGWYKVPETQEQDLLRSADVARLLGVHTTTVWRWIKDKKLIPSHRIFDIPVFERRYIEAFAESRKEAIATEAVA